MGPRYIEVFASDEDEYFAAVEGRPTGGRGGGVKPVAAPRPSAGASRVMGVKGRGVGKSDEPCTEPVLRCRGLPYSASVEELVELFAEYDLVSDNVCIGVCTAGNQQGKPSGDAILRFHSLEQAEAAMSGMQGATFGSRYLELFPCTEAELEKKASIGGIAGYEANARPTGDVNPQENRRGSGWIRLRGLPFTASVEDILEFCGDSIGISQNDVTIKYGTDGRPSGEAFIQVDSNAIAEEACSVLHKQHMGERYIECLMSSHDESMATRTNQRPSPYGRPGGFGGFGGGKGKGRGKW